LSRTDGVHLPRRKFLALFGAALAVPVSLSAAEKGAAPKPQNVLSPDEALDRLMKGNHRYVEGTMRRHDFIAERPALALDQNPLRGSSVAQTHGLDLSTPSIPVVGIFLSAG
jgi:hypothetical protein